MKLYILHDNATWLVPICKQLNALGVPFELWDLGTGSIDLTQTPPEGVFFNRVSPSSHGRGKRYAMELGAAVVEWLERHGRRVVNGSGALRLENSKVSQEMAMQQHGIASPITTAVTGRDSLAEALDGFVARIGGGNFLLKHNRGGSGMGVRLFSDAEQARRYVADDAAFEESPDGVTLLQAAVDSPAQEMYRMEFVNGQFLYAVKIDTSSVKADSAINNCPADSCQLKEQQKKRRAATAATTAAVIPAPTASSATAAAPSTPTSASRAPASASASAPVELDSVDAYRSAAAAAHAAGKAFVLQFGASWCGACKRAKPAIAALRSAHASQAAFGYADADEADELVDELSVKSLPSYMVQMPGEKAPTALSLEQLGEHLRSRGSGAVAAPAAPSRKRKATGGAEAEVAAAEPEAKRVKAAVKADPTAAAHGGGMGNCPLSTPVEKFALQPIADFKAKHAELIGKFEALMRTNNVDIAGAEIIFDAAGRPQCIDVNSNTNYSVSAETRFGEAYYGSKRLAAFLHRELEGARARQAASGLVVPGVPATPVRKTAACPSPSLQGSESDDEVAVLHSLKLGRDAKTPATDVMRDAHAVVLRLLESAGGLEGLKRLQQAVESSPLAPKPIGVEQ